MLEDKIKKYVIPVAIAFSSTIYSGCATEKDPLLVQCCESISCENQSGYSCSQATSSQYYTPTSCVEDKQGNKMCCACEEKVQGGKGW